MGRDKALVPFRGRPLVTVARDALVGAGATEVLAVGGAAAALRQQGLRPVPDRWPGEGPLGGIITALGAVDAPVTVVLACDLVAIHASTVRRLVAELGASDADVAVPVVAGRPQVLVAAWRTGCCSTLDAAFGAGVRGPSEALEHLVVRRVPGLGGVQVADADSPDELAGYDRR